MANRKILQLLLVEDDPTDEQFIREALLEIEENLLWCNWHSSDLVHVTHLADALDCLARQHFDAVLLNLGLPGSGLPLNTFLEVQNAAGDVPVIVLAGQTDENFAGRLMREGAQDVLLKSELECAPLARSIRFAIARQNRLAALKTSSYIDELTGLYNREAFERFAAHDAQLLRNGSGPPVLAVLELADVEDREHRHLLLSRMADMFRSLFDNSTTLARIGKQSFGILTAGMSEGTMERLAEKIEIELGGSASIRVGCATFCTDGSATMEELLTMAMQRLSPKTVMLAD